MIPNLFAKKVPVKILLVLAQNLNENLSYTKIIRNNGIGCNSGDKYLQKFREIGLVSTRKVGKKLKIKLTERGRLIVEFLLKLNLLFETEIHSNK